MCEVLGVESVAVPADAAGRMDLDALEELLAGRPGGHGGADRRHHRAVGAVDPVAEALALRDRYGCRLHVDAAYGGFFALLAGDEDGAKLLGRRRRPGCGRWGRATRWWSTRTSTGSSRTAAGRCCSATRRGPAVPARLALHLLHLRRAPPGRDQPGVLAGRGGRGALWLTLRALPLRATDGLGPVVAGRPAGGQGLGRAAGGQRGSSSSTSRPSSTSSPSGPARVAVVRGRGRRLGRPAAGGHARPVAGVPQHPAPGRRPPPPPRPRPWPPTSARPGSCAAC